MCKVADALRHQGWIPSGIALSTVMHSLIPLGAAKEPLTDMQTWADSRSAGIVRELKEHEPALCRSFYERTGCPMHACYPLAKILWLKQNRPELFARIKYIGPIKDYLFHAFTGKFLIDCSAYESVRSILEGIAARAEGEPCCTYIGEDGAGHYVKMVHNGIEYADMQIIAETYLILKHVGGLLNARIGEIFHEWNSGELRSYLIGITADIFAERDEETGKALVDIIVDHAGQKGTGRWTSLEALARGVDLSMIPLHAMRASHSALRAARRSRRS